MTAQSNSRLRGSRSDVICECGHPIAEHAESGWGENTVCVEPMAKPDEGWYGVCPCVRRDGEGQ